MDNNHYIPDISDLFVGYECEEASTVKDPVPYLCTVYEDRNGYEILNVDTFYLRTPFLTKEQIESEGWKKRPCDRFLHLIKGEIDPEEDFTGYEYRLFMNTIDDKPFITIDKLNINFGKAVYDCYEGNCNTIFKGYCPSINEFRKICKLLDI